MAQSRRMRWFCIIATMPDALTLTIYTQGTTSKMQLTGLCENRTAMRLGQKQRKQNLLTTK